MIKSKITLGRVVEKYFYILTLIRSSVLYFNVYKNINKISKLYSLPLFKDCNLKNSDTLFILGSSNGINSITKDQWAHIRELSYMGPLILSYRVYTIARAKNK